MVAGKIRELDETNIGFILQAIGREQLSMINIELIKGKYYVRYEEEKNKSSKLMELYTILNDFDVNDTKIKSYYLYYNSEIDTVIINKSESESIEMPNDISSVAKCITGLKTAINSLEDLPIKDETITFKEGRKRTKVSVSKALEEVMSHLMNTIEK